MFRFIPDGANDPWYCPVKLIMMEEYVYFEATIGVNMSVGYLYTKINNTCQQDVERLSTSHLCARFRFYLQKAAMDNCSQGDLKLSIHSLWAGIL